MLDKNGYVLPKIETSNHFSLPIMSNYNNSIELYPIGQKVLSVKTKESIEWLNQIRTKYQFLYNNLSEIRLVSDVANELKNDLRQDVRRVEKIVNDVEQQVKEDSRDNAKDLKVTIDTVEDDMKKLEDRLKQAQKELEEKMEKRIKLALENPLGAMGG